MAILSSLPGLSVTIHTDKGQLTEYPDDEPELVEGLKVSQDRVVSSYVESEAGELFWFQLRIDNSYDKPYSHPLSFRFEINGERITKDGRHYYPTNTPAHLWMSEERGISVNTDAGPVLKRFKFLTLESIPHDEYISNSTESEEKKLSKMGMLEVRVCEIKERPAQKKTLKKNGTKEKPATKKKQARKPSQEDEQRMAQVQGSSLKKADEKAIQKKSMSLGIEYSDEPQKKAEKTSSFEYVQSYNHPLAVFRFKYRCKADLEKLLIIRRETIPHSEKQLASGSIIKHQKSDEGSLRLGFQARSGPSASMPPSFSSFCPKPSPPQNFASSPPQSELAALLSSLVQTGTRANVDDYEARIRALLAPSPLHQPAPAPKQFEELTEDELRELAKKKHKAFDSLEDEEIRRIAREHYKDFVDLTEDEVKELARDEYDEMRGIKTVKDEVKAEKIIKEEQTTVKSENRFPKTPLADIAPAPGPQIGEKRTIDLTLDEDADVIQLFDVTPTKKTKSRRLASGRRETANFIDLGEAEYEH